MMFDDFDTQIQADELAPKAAPMSLTSREKIKRLSKQIEAKIRNALSYNESEIPGREFAETLQRVAEEGAVALTGGLKLTPSISGSFLEVYDASGSFLTTLAPEPEQGYTLLIPF